MDGQDGQHVEVRWAKLDLPRKSGWEPLQPCGSQINRAGVRSMRFAGQLWGHVLSSCYRGKDWPVNGIEPS